MIKQLKKQDNQYLYEEIRASNRHWNHDLKKDICPPWWQPSVLIMWLKFITSTNQTKATKQHFFETEAA